MMFLFVRYKILSFRHALHTLIPIAVHCAREISRDNQLRSIFVQIRHKMSHRITTLSLFLVLLAGASSLTAQDLAFGFKAGLNFSSFSGPLQEDPTGTVIEDFQVNNGFHLGIGATFMATDLFGVRTELIYSQRGGRIEYDGPSYYVVTAQSGNRIPIFGNRRQFLDITNSCIDLPIMAVARFGRFELTGGLNAGVLLASSGAGEIDFRNGTVNGDGNINFLITLDYDFFGDAGNQGNANNPYQFSANGEDFEIPRTVGAYYEFEDNEERLYTTFDLAAVAGLSFYFNEALYVGGRLNYGLVDVTRTDLDRSAIELDVDGEPARRDDFDRNIWVQASIGFNF